MDDACTLLPRSQCHDFTDTIYLTVLAQSSMARNAVSQQWWTCGHGHLQKHEHRSCRESKTNGFAADGAGLCLIDIANYQKRPSFELISRTEDLH
jgi:hypothetical protein